MKTPKIAAKRGSPIPPDTRTLLVGLYAEIERLSKRFNISHRGTQVWHAEVDLGKFLIVVADGLGGGTMIYGQGNGGDDYVMIESREFASEHKACALASTCLEQDGGVDMERLRTAFDASKTPEADIGAS